MSTTADTAELPAAGSASAGSDVPALVERGATHIADRVVEKIAGQAVREVDRAGGLSRQLLGMRLSRESLDRDARTSARVDGGIVTVDVQLSVLYPCSARQIAGEVRAHLIERVQALTGLRVGYVDIRIARLLTRADERGKIR